MSNIVALKKQVKSYQDFKKVINIQKIVIMKEIAEWKKLVSEANMMEETYKVLLFKMYKTHGALYSDIFINPKGNANSSRVPVKRNLRVIIQGAVADAIGDYEFKLIAENARKKHDENDIYLIVGDELAEYMKNKGFNLINSLTIEDLWSPKIYRRLSNQVLEAFRDMLFVEAHVSFLDISTKRVHETRIFPIEVTNDSKNMFKNPKNTFKTIANIRLGRATWEKDFDVISRKFLNTTVEMSSYASLAKYRLSMKTRELQSLDDKEKNIQSEIEIIKLRMQRVRKEEITNELLTNATAFAALTEEDDDD